MQRVSVAHHGMCNSGAAGRRKVCCCKELCSAEEVQCGPGNTAGSSGVCGTAKPLGSAPHISVTKLFGIKCSKHHMLLRATQVPPSRVLTSDVLVLLLLLLLLLAGGVSGCAVLSAVRDAVCCSCCCWLGGLKLCEPAAQMTSTFNCMYQCANHARVTMVPCPARLSCEETHAQKLQLQNLQAWRCNATAAAHLAPPSSTKTTLEATSDEPRPSSRDLRCCCCVLSPCCCCQHSRRMRTAASKQDPPPLLPFKPSCDHRLHLSSLNAAERVPHDGWQVD
jgi:hypothetical protein